MSNGSSNVKIETLAWITDDEAEFWTNRSPINQREMSNYSRSTRDSSTDAFVFDDLELETDNGNSTQTSDSLALFYRKTIEKQANEVIEQAEKNPLPNIFQSDENNPRISTNFLEHLNNQESPMVTNLEQSSSDDDVFTEIDESEITAATDDNFSVGKIFDGVKKLTDDFPLFNIFNSFFDDLNEETEVVIGNIDEEALFNRRSRKATTPVQLQQNGQIDDTDNVF